MNIFLKTDVMLVNELDISRSLHMIVYLFLLDVKFHKIYLDLFVIRAPLFCWLLQVEISHIKLPVRLTGLWFLFPGTKRLVFPKLRRENRRGIFVYFFPFSFFVNFYYLFIHIFLLWNSRRANKPITEACVEITLFVIRSWRKRFLRM